ncbi:hypothetical protein R3P38DRAFT_2811029 [Favolaschia claudopus]|uniref:Uncharacterized protein n=1 Tax=Favolaschia claudopus TaxID=2862362 RepID=A0AAV9Z9R0_9AGAR
MSTSNFVDEDTKESPTPPPVNTGRLNSSQVCTDETGVQRLEYDLHKLSAALQVLSAKNLALTPEARKFLTEELVPYEIVIVLKVIEQFTNRSTPPGTQIIGWYLKQIQKMLLYIKVEPEDLADAEVVEGATVGWVPDLDSTWLTRREDPPEACLGSQQFFFRRILSEGMTNIHGSGGRLADIVTAHKGPGAVWKEVFGGDILYDRWIGDPKRRPNADRQAAVWWIEASTSRRLSPYRSLWRHGSWFSSDSQRVQDRDNDSDE